MFFIKIKYLKNMKTSNKFFDHKKKKPNLTTFCFIENLDKPNNAAKTFLIYVFLKKSLKQLPYNEKKPNTVLNQPPKNIKQYQNHLFKKNHILDFQKRKQNKNVFLASPFHFKVVKKHLHIPSVIVTIRIIQPTRSVARTLHRYKLPTLIYCSNHTTYKLTI